MLHTLPILLQEELTIPPFVLLLSVTYEPYPSTSHVYICI